MKSESHRTGTGADAAPGEPPRSWLSALADGRAEALQPGCQQWRDDPQARQTWHTYHLIGDVMRSEDLARAPARDAAFLAGLRERLAAEPVVLAPVEPVPQRHRPWLLPAAAAAGFVVVAGVLVVARLGNPGGAGEPAAGPALAAASAVGPGNAVPQFVSAEAQPPQAAPLQPAIRVGRSDDLVLRDPHLQELLRAHQAARGGVAVAAPGGVLRRVDATAVTVLPAVPPAAPAEAAPNNGAAR